MREVLWSQPQEAPETEIHRFHREFVGQIEVLIAQFGEVAFIECRLLIIVGYRIQFQ